MGRGRGRGGRGGGRGGRGGGGGGGGDFDGEGGGGGGFEDQYGGGFGSQDRDSFQGFSKAGGGGGTGGGTAGSRGKPGANVNFQRQVPKFLQKYQHLLGGRGGQPSEDEPTMDEESMAALAAKSYRPGDADEEDRPGQDDDIEVEALRRAMADNPELAKEFEGTLQKRLAQAQAAEEKERGNKLFGSKKYKEAIESFTKCIELDPSNEVFFSNRSAAFASLEQWEEALADAKKAVALKPRWAKAHQRVATAFMGLQLYSDAKEALEQAQKLEPDNQAVQSALQKAEIMELQQVRDKKHVFKKRKLGGGEAGAAGAGEGRDSKAKKGGLLSFGGDEEE